MIPAWLAAPLVGVPELFQRTGLPDPFAVVGRHVQWVTVGPGEYVRHGVWTRTHGGCPAGCRTLPQVPEARDPEPGWMQRIVVPGVVSRKRRMPKGLRRRVEPPVGIAQGVGVATVVLRTLTDGGY